VNDAIGRWSLIRIRTSDIHVTRTSLCRASDREYGIATRAHKRHVRGDRDHRADPEVSRVAVNDATPRAIARIMQEVRAQTIRSVFR